MKINKLSRSNFISQIFFNFHTTGVFSNFTFGEFNQLFRGMKINWKKVLGSLTAIEISDDIVISVLDIEQFIRKIRWLESFDDARFLNNIYANFFYKFRTLVSYHSVISEQSCGNETSIKVATRRDQCLDIIQSDLTFVLPPIISRLTGSKQRELVQKTLDRVVKQLKTNIMKNTKQSFYNRREIVRQIDSFVENKYFGVNLPNVWPNEKLQDFLQNINNESLLIEIRENSTSAFLKNHNELSDNYLALTESLMFMSYPYIHYDLPRYWNDAHLVPLILWKLKEIIAEFSGSAKTWQNDDSINEAFEFYEIWDNEQNEVDESLPGLHHLNNKQMFWLSLTHQRCLKSENVAGNDYIGSEKQILRTFGCQFEPKYLNRFGLFSPPAYAKISFLNEKYFTDLNMQIY